MRAFLWLSLGVLFTAVTPAVADQQAACVPLNSTITMYDDGDVMECPVQVAKAAALGNKSINLLVTANFILDKDKKVSGYCLRSWQGPCEPVTPERLDRIKKEWRDCVSSAVEKEMDISLYVQIDEAPGGFNVWRNNLVFDPLQKYGGYSYDDVLLRPLAEILQSTALPETKIEFSLQGEMGATLAHHAPSYVELIKTTKERLKPLTNVLVGINMNYTAVFGFGTKLTATQVPQVQNLLNATEFVGLSTYHEVMIPVEAENFTFSQEMAYDEMRRSGVKVPFGKRTRISEIGMGGGNRTDDGKSPAKTIEEAAACLWSGVRGVYNIALDPFQNPAIHSFRRDYYRELLKYLKSPPENFNLKSAYLWNSDSWDVQGLSVNGTHYVDPQIVESIRQHNADCK